MLENIGKCKKSLLKIPYEDEKIPQSCRIIPMSNEWVSIALQEEFEQWCPTQPVMIAAPTGKGKTTFVGDIAKFWKKAQKGQKVLLLVNRTAVATQQKRELAKKLGSSWGKVSDIQAFELIDDFPDIGLTVKTYQAFEAQYHKMDLQSYGWVIFDEAHYFLADSIFNDHLDQIFWKLPTLFSHARRVYMTATPGAVLPDICEAEKGNLVQCAKCQRCFWQDDLGMDLCGALRVYDFPSQFDQIELSYFREREEVLSLVQKHPGEKFLIFTSRREANDTPHAKSYTNMFRDNGIWVEYLDRFSKDSDVWREVCQQGRFEAQVLVCTSVLDCGVSFHDDKLRHIVVETADKTEFSQMLGRKRLKEGERLKVYIRALDKGGLCCQLKNVENQLRFIYLAKRAIAEKQCDKLIFGAWHDQNEDRLYARLLNYHGHGSVSIKKTAEHSLRWRKGTINRLLRDTDEFGDDSALPRLAHEWLDQKGGYDTTRWLDYDKKAKTEAMLLAFLEGYIGKNLDEHEWREFTSEFIDLSSAITAFPHDNVRKSNLKCCAINTRFRSLGVMYIAKKQKSTYKIVRKMEDVHEMQ